MPNKSREIQQDKDRLKTDVLKSYVELVDIKEVKPSSYVNIKNILPLYAKFLNKGIVDEAILVDKKHGVIVKGHDSYYALDLLSAKKVPIFKVNISDIEITPLSKAAIIEAGLKGPKLPPNSFDAQFEIPKIDIPLGKLLEIKERDRNILRVYHSTTELLYEGWPTPIVKLNSLSSKNRSVWAKLEGYNPFSNSVKDRIGFSMIMEARNRGELREILYEATSTNTGIALTSIANTLGLKTKLYIPKTIQKVSDVYLNVLGAKVVRLPVGLTVEAIDRVDSEARANKAMHLNQFENDANFKVHLKYTAKELDEQLQIEGLKPFCIIGGLGTSGHMSAIAFYFKNKYKDNIEIIGVQPAPNEVIPGIRRIETGMKWYHWVRFDKIINVKQSEAIEGCIKIARKEGLLIGLSAGAVVHAFTKIAKEKGVYVLVFPDTGYKYAEQFEKYLANYKTLIENPPQYKIVSPKDNHF
jgi:cysteine synthase/O-phosphoserine sulfhydrylase/cystathionine beta-synthase